MSVSGIDRYLLSGVFPVLKLRGKTCARYLEDIKSKVLKDLVDAGKLDETAFTKHVKLGHGGVLDIDAEGVLVVASFRSCRVLPALLEGMKTYVAEGILGKETDTYNSLGKVVKELPFEHVTQGQLEECLKRYEGHIMQKPPAYSSLKLSGRRASDLARLGYKIDLEPREVFCKKIKFLSFRPPSFSLEIRCGGGFYVRSLINDLGKDLRTCAHMGKLVRVAQGPFRLSDCLHEDDWLVDNINNSIRRHAPTVQKYVTEANARFRRRKYEW